MEYNIVVYIQGCISNDYFMLLLRNILKTIPNIPDWTILLLLLGIICVVATLYIGLDTGFTAKTILDGFIYGLLNSAVAVYGNYVVKQIKNDE